MTDQRLHVAADDVASDHASDRFPRCAEWAREVELDPAGTAPQADIFVLVEHPLPWPRDVGTDPLIADVERAAREHAGGRSVRVQALAVDRAMATRRVIVFASGGPSFGGYGRLEDSAMPGRLADVAGRLVAADVPEPVRGRVTDVLVCTHGTRDTCCGSLGTRLWRDLDAGGATVRRTSHTGGHRFAPTAVTFPDGNYWAFLEPELAVGIVERTVSAEIAAAHLRGCAAFAPAVQVADCAALESQGWDWLSYERQGIQGGADEHGGSDIELRYETPAGQRGVYDVRVEHGRQMPVPDCGADPATAAKAQHEWRVTSFESSVR